MRARGIFLEIHARLPAPLAKLFHIESRVLTLRLPEDSDADIEVGWRSCPKPCATSRTCRSFAAKSRIF